MGSEMCIRDSAQVRPLPGRGPLRPKVRARGQGVQDPEAGRLGPRGRGALLQPLLRRRGAAREVWCLGRIRGDLHSVTRLSLDARRGFIGTHIHTPGRWSRIHHTHARRGPSPDAGGKTLDFECVDATCDRAAARTLFAWTFDRIVAEARGTKIFVDKSGAPVSRKAPKKRLRMILGAR